jgi:protein O-mannosyl-transferase
VEDAQLSTAPARAKPSEAPTWSSAEFFASPEKRTFVLSLLLVVFTLALYNQASHFPFISYDDDRYVYENAHVRAGLTWSTVNWALISTDEANWHPLTWLSHALDCQLFRLNPNGHHLSSILLHAVNVVLLFLLLWRGTRRLGPSFFVAALFALHPMNVESVAWVAERKNVLSTLFFFLILGAYGWYALRPGWKRYLGVMTLFAAGLASKPMLVTLPVVLLLLDYWPLGRIQGCSEPSEVLAAKPFPAVKLMLEKLPLLALAGASSLITLHAQRGAGAVITSQFSLGARLQNAIYSYAMYVWKTVWPTGLAPLYPHPHSLAIWKVGAAAVFLIAITALALKLRSRRYVLTGWLWFLGTLVPVIGVLQVGNQAMADRYAYIPLIGLFVMIGWGVADLVESKKLGLAWPAVPATCVLLGLSLVAYRQIGYWRSGLDLWTHTNQVTEHNYVAEDNLGVALVKADRAEEAYPYFLRASQDEPAYPSARLNLGVYLYQHGRQSEAIGQYKLAAGLASDSRVRATAYTNLGIAYYDLGDAAKAEASFAQALQLNPSQVDAWLGMALLAQRQGKLEEEISDLSQVLELQPTGKGYLQLGRLLAQQNHRAEAVAAFEQALRIAPDLTEAREAAEELKRQ